mgnify:CR=1 FL=1
MGRILIILGLLFFTLSIIGNYLDVKLHVTGKSGYTQIGHMWYKFHPESLQISEAIISRYVDPCSSLEILNCSGFLWHPIISSFLMLPAGLIFAIISIISIFYGVKKRRYFIKKN